MAAIKNAEGGRERVAPISKSRGEESLKRGGVSEARGRASEHATDVHEFIAMEAAEFGVEKSMQHRILFGFPCPVPPYASEQVPPDKLLSVS